MSNNFKNEIPTFEQRKLNAETQRKENNDCALVILEKSPKANIWGNKRISFALQDPAKITIHQFYGCVREKFDLQPEENLFLFLKHNTTSILKQCEGISPTMLMLYNNYHEDDLHLHITYSNKNENKLIFSN